jgi:hypothetical protein
MRISKAVRLRRVAGESSWLIAGVLSKSSVHIKVGRAGPSVPRVYGELLESQLLTIGHGALGTARPTTKSLGQQSRVASSLAIALGLVTYWLPSAQAAAAHRIAAGMLNVAQVVAEDTNNNARVTLALGFNHFLAGSGNRGDYNVQIGIGLEATYDQSRGVLMTSVTENGRDNFGTNGYPISAFATNGGGAGNSIEYNVNVAGAWFPYDRYLGGFARNSAGLNGATNDLFTGSPGLVLSTHFRGVAGGKSVVDLRSLGIDSRTDGVLLVTHAKDECNFALSQVNANDGTWNVFVRDPAQTTSAPTARATWRSAW